jgi:Kef-type K+ transport system membrane component KefB
MTATIIIIFCSLLLIAYIFNLTAEKTRIPSVILLLALGWGIKESTGYFQIGVPDFSPFLPILATIGLVLIVLEGSLELELSKSKIGKITKSALGAFLMILTLAFVLAYSFHYFGGYSLLVVR